MDTFSSATELAGAVSRREVSPLELLDACLAQVDRLNPSLNAIVWRNDDQARSQAKMLGETLVKGDVSLPPFAGVPLPIKDLTPVEGQPITYGSWSGSDDPAEEDELVVAAFRKAGFILCGRTNAPEVGSLPVTENLRYGITRNPWDLSRSPGGSSGGAAAAVASGMFPLAHANDGGGSIRIPASCSGLVGLIPSRGRVPAIVPGWLGCAVEGVLTRSVADTAAVLDQISGPDPLSWFNAPVPNRPFAAAVGTDPGRLRIGLLTRAPLGLPMAAGCRDALVEAGTALAEIGHDVFDLDEDLFPPEMMMTLLPMLHAGMGDYVHLDEARTEAHIRAEFDAARAVNSLELVDALGRLQRFSRRFVARWGSEFDLLVTPTMLIEPPRAGAVLDQALAHPTEMSADVLAMAVLCGPFSVSGQPAISLPLHWSDEGLPIGVQVVAGPWQEDLLLAVASQLESTRPWHERHPPAPAA
jgi:amidase